jgi:hypothetical protein
LRKDKYRSLDGLQESKGRINKKSEYSIESGEKGKVDRDEGFHKAEQFRVGNETIG